MVVRSFLLFPDLQNPDLVFSATYLYPALRDSAFSPNKSGKLRLSPLISREKSSGLLPVIAEKTSCPSGYCKVFDALSSIKRG